MREFVRVVGLLSMMAFGGLLRAQTAIEQGRQFYLGHCAQCHGRDGEGGRGVNLTTGVFRFSSNDEELLRTIRDGLRGTEMPGSRLPAADLRKLVGYLRELGRAGAAEKAKGDAVAGERVYAKAGCAQCHVVSGSGGGLGPVLDAIGLRRSLKFLRDSLTDPGAYNPKEYAGARVVTDSGEAVTGVRLNEDDYSIQVRDQQGRFRSFYKRDVRSAVRLEESLMPSYKGLGAKDLEDLVAYLSTLRKAE